MSVIDNSDFIVLTEIGNCSDLEIVGYKSFVQCSTPNQSRKGGRNSGGIALFYKNKLHKNISITKTTQNFLWFKIEKSFLNSVKDIYVCGVYIPPCNSKYFDLEIFDQLERDIVHFSTIGSVILMGDFNSRTGKYSDTVSQEGNSIITNDQSESAFQPAQRNSFDNLLNSHGKKLLEICKNLDLRIVNGRVNGDTLGRPTFHGKNGTSVIDYIICDQCTFLNVANFVVKQPSYLSDHSAIVAWLNLNTSLPASETQTSTSTNRLISLPRQFCWENDSYLKFRNALRTEPIQILIREFMERNTEDVNVSLDDAVNILTATSKICLKIKTKRSRKRIRITSSKKWFDRECQLKRHELRKLSNQKHRDPLNSELREKFHKILNDYKKLLDSKRKEFQKEKTLQLDELAFNPDKVSFWSCLKSMNDTIDENVPAPISEETWLNHFQSLHSNDLRTSINRQGVYDELLSLEKEKEQLNYLDQEVTEQEIRQAVKKLKNKKSPFVDKIRNEMIKASLESLMPIYIKLFNLILQSGKMPDIWCQGLITPIYKSGDKSDPTNYRGICVSSCLGKLFCSILNQRLYLYFRENKILHNSQIGFVPENRTADHVFTLRTLIDKYVHYHKEKVYACFVDFRKAFDSVWHEGLFYKLLKINIGGHFYNLIKSLYCNSTCSIRIGENKTRSFSYSRGVRQGCILSPLLFNLYINNLPYLFENTLSDPFVLPNGTKINSLLYADDLIILSRSKTGLQNCLNTLSSYCKTWMLKVNPKKTKVMIFQKRPRKSVDINFNIGTEPIEIVQEYTYLGTRLTPTGNFTLAVEHLKEKALYAFASIRKQTLLNRLNPNTASQIFDTMIFPILSYNSEIWGMYTKQNFKAWDSSPIEKIHLKFCKHYLEVNNKASNVACRAELGRLPLIIPINQKIMKYFVYLNNKDNDSIVKQSFLMSKNLHFINNSGFYSNFMNLIEQYHLSNLDPESLDNDRIRRYTTNMKEKYISSWRHSLEHSKKLEFYKVFKDDYVTSDYLNQLRNFNERRNLVKFRVSNHKLMIELGRYQTDHMPRETRLCPLCKSNQVENETHFLLQCSKYSLQRQTFFNRINEIIPDIERKSTSESIKLLMNSNDYHVNKLVMKFISLCMNIRDTLLLSSESDVT